MTDDTQHWDAQEIEKQVDQHPSGRETYKTSSPDRQFLHDLRFILAVEEHDIQPQTDERVLEHAWTRIVANNTSGWETSHSAQRRFINMATLPSMPDQSIIRRNAFKRRLTTIIAASITLLLLSGTLAIFTLAHQSQPNTKTGATQVQTQPTQIGSSYVYHQSGDPIYDLQWTADGQRIFSSNASIVGWDAFTGAHRIQYVQSSGAAGAVLSTQLSPDNKTLAVFDVGKIELYDVASGKHLSDLTYPFSETAGVKLNSPSFEPYISWSPDGRFIRTLIQIPTANASRSNKIVTYNVANGSYQEATLNLTEQLTQVAWSPNGKFVAVGRTSAGSVSVINVANEQVVSTLHEGAPIEGIPLTWSPDSRHLAADFGNGTGIAVWDAGKVGDVSFYQPGTTQPVWSPDGKYIAVISGTNVKILNASNGHVLKNYTSESSTLYALAWSPDSTALAAGGATGSESGIVNVWKLSL